MKSPSRPSVSRSTWPVSRTYALLTTLCFALAGVSIAVDWLGPPMIFAFTTLCSVFLVFGAIQWKLERSNAVDRGPEQRGREAQTWQGSDFGDE